MNRTSLPPLALVLAASCAAAPRTPAPVPAAKAAPTAASGRPEIRYYEINDA